MREAGRRAVQGAVLALGAPLGWLALRAASGHPPDEEISRHLGLYTYLLVSTGVAFSGFAAALGRAEARAKQAALRHEVDALTDPLTGLKNLRYFQARLHEEDAASRRTSAPLAIAVIDLDHFKRVNDRHGHPEGDRVLRAVAGSVASVARHGETAARIGGEEFAVLLPGADGKHAVAVSERIRAAVGALRIHLSKGTIVTITVSVGSASTADLGDVSPDELYAAADAALYTAKRRGRNRTVRAGVPHAASAH